MADVTLFHFPGACSRVTMTALEHCGVEYDDVPVNLAKGEQVRPEYRATNPRGKIPALLVGGRLLTENAAIQLWLDSVYPDAGLLPKAESDWDRAQIISDLAWISSGWHPSVRANMMPVRWTTGDPAPVRERGKQLMAPLLEQLETRLSRQPWWYGDDWSIADTYFYWCYTTAEEGQYDLSGLDAIADHRQRVAAQPAFRRAVEREAKARERMLAAAGE